MYKCRKIDAKKKVLIVTLTILALLTLPMHAQSASQEWELVAQYGGKTEAVLAQGDRLYLGMGLHVLIMDASDDEQLVLLGNSPMLPDVAQSISIIGEGLLAVSCGSGGMVLLDVRDPSDVCIVGALDTLGIAHRTAVYGDYVLVADGPQGVQIVNAAKPEKPVVVAQAYPLANIYDIAVVGNTAYAAGGGSGLFVVDITDPTAPIEMGLVQLNGFQYGVTAVGDTLYTAGGWSGVSVLDISRAHAPTVTHTIDTVGWAFDVEMIQTGLLVAEGSEGVSCYQPSNGERIANYDQNGMTKHLAVANNTIYSLDLRRGLVTLAFTADEKLQFISQWMPLLDARRLALDGTFCYVAGGLTGLQVLDLQSVISPSPIPIFWRDAVNGYVNSIAISGNTGYYAMQYDTEELVVSFDKSDPYNIKILNAYKAVEGTPSFTTRAIVERAGFIYIAGEWSGDVLDARDPSQMVSATHFWMDDVTNCALRGNLLVISSGKELAVLDVTDPYDMHVISSFTQQTSATGVCFLTDSLFMAGNLYGVSMIDLSNPLAPKLVGQIELPSTPEDIYLNDNTAYLCCKGGGVIMLDVSNPLNPVQIGTVSTLGAAWDCYVQGDLLIVADGDAGVSVYRQSNARREVQTQHEETLLTMGTRDTSALTEEWVQPDTEQSPVGKQMVITSSADSGEGTLREALTLGANQYISGMTITFDPDVFPPEQPVAILLEYQLPSFDPPYLTIDASNAGVILDGSRLTEGCGLHFYSPYATVMGLQIHDFPEDGIRVDGSYSLIGGDRTIGQGPVGQGNQISGCQNGILVNANHATIQGNLLGVDVTGKTCCDNERGISLSTGANNAVVGGTLPGLGNVCSGNREYNLNSWAGQVRIIGNIFGLDMAGTYAIRKDTRGNILFESGASNSVLGGTTPPERNIISGADNGIGFSDMNTYQISVIGNYIGTDITGMKAIPNRWAIGSNVSYYHRIGGTRPGEGNVISGNENGVGIIQGSVVLGNLIGYAADGKTPLPNNTSVTLYPDTLIGGYTPAEGNRIYAKHFGLRQEERGNLNAVIIGNFFSGDKGMDPIWLQGVNRVFVQSNEFDSRCNQGVAVIQGQSVLIMNNIYVIEKLENAHFLAEGANGDLVSPNISEAKGKEIAGTTCPYGYVEICQIMEGRLSRIGFTFANAKGEFTYTHHEPLSGTQVMLAVTNGAGNTSSMSSMPIKVE